MRRSSSRNLLSSRPIVFLRARLPNHWVNLLYHLPKAVLANLRYGFPSRRLTVVGVTGTKGKTTTAHLLHYILQNRGKKVVLISTIGAFFGEGVVETGLHVTNPEPFLLQGLLRKAADEGYTHVVLEVTSQGLAQFRNLGITFSVAVFTQVTADHLDYHKNREEYLRTKAMLMNSADHVLVNAVDPSRDFLSRYARSKRIPLSVYRRKSEDFESQNREAAIACASLLGIERSRSRETLQSFPGVPGRMQLVRGSPFKVVIDFAHTPESLERALEKLRGEVAKGGRLIAVFGCAGDRDHGRRRMGKIAASLANFFVVTAEDPRTEDVRTISAEIARYAKAAGAVELTKGEEKHPTKKRATFVRIDDRQAAIDYAIAKAVAGDVIGIFGKGHEKSMCFETEEIPWSDEEAVAKALQKKRGE